MAVVFRDVPDCKRAQEDHDLLIDELNHRVNMLATIRSAARQTLTGYAVPAAAHRGFEARLQAPGNVKSLLIDQNWRAPACAT